MRAAALQGAGSRATLLVSHNPDILPELPPGIGLTLSGHTHGGQLCVPFHGALVTNCDLDTSRVKGVSRWWPGASGVGPL